jgi:selenide,water dikinase
MTELQQLLMCDAQTSGGLLIAVSPDRLDDLLAGLTAELTPIAAVVGTITDGTPGSIRVTA